MVTYPPRKTSKNRKSQKQQNDKLKNVTNDALQNQSIAIMAFACASLEKDVKRMLQTLANLFIEVTNEDFKSPDDSNKSWHIDHVMDNLDKTYRMLKSIRDDKEYYNSLIK